MNIAIPQLNLRTGDIAYNKELMSKAIKQAKQMKAELIVFPEMAITGPFPGDLLEKETFITDCRLAIDQLASQCGKMAAIIGGPNLDLQNGIMYNSAYFIQNQEVVDGVHKSMLSDYDIYNESRYFVTAEESGAIKYKGVNIRIIFDEYESELIEKNDQLIINIGQAPFAYNATKQRIEASKNIAKRAHKPLITLNCVGGYTSVLFEGASHIINSKGTEVQRLKSFEEDFEVINLSLLDKMPALKENSQEPIAEIHDALVMGLRDYFNKHNFKSAILGFSGGIDSAVVAALAAKAIGGENVYGLLMPSHFSSDHSIKDATDLAKNIGAHYQIIEIAPMYDQYLKGLEPLFEGTDFCVAEENIQARIRGTLVMAASNKFGHIALNTSNKSEAAVGYGTLYGDLCGSLGCIGDLFKTQVYELARYINKEQVIIPENTITKEPSAELRPNQKDSDSLPPYDILDEILRFYIEQNLSNKQIIKLGYKAEFVDRILSMVDRNEYKRAQCPPILKVSNKSFGSGRQFPF